MKAFTYIGLTLIMLTTIVLSIKTFYYTDDINPVLFIVTGFVIFIFCYRYFVAGLSAGAVKGWSRQKAAEDRSRFDLDSKSITIGRRFMASYDYINVGAGSAGCVLATRLSEDANVSVLLIEAGGGKSMFVDMPAGIKVLYTSGRYNWRFWTEPQRHLDNRRIYIPRGRVIGGSSSINSMIAIRCAVSNCCR